MISCNPTCAMQTPRVQQQPWVLQPGISARQRPLAVNADANVKLDHYASCGAKVTAAYQRAGLAPQIVDGYFGPVGRIASLYQTKAQEEHGGDSGGRGS